MTLGVSEAASLKEVVDIHTAYLSDDGRRPPRFSIRC